MRKLLGNFLLFFSIGAMGANPVAPDWMDALVRETSYPTSKYYTGFATTTIQKGEEKTVAYDRVKQNARVEAISSIQVTVEQTVERFIKNAQSCGSVSTVDIMNLHAKSQTSFKDVSGLKVETWENPKTGEISAFAWVKIVDLFSHLVRRTAVNIGKIETELRNVDLLLERGEKIQAKSNLSNIQTMLDDLESDQRVMLSIDPSVSDEELSIEEVTRLKNKYQNLAAELKNGLNIYLECKADLFGATNFVLCGEIKGELSKMGVSFVSSPELSDWAIYVSAVAREYNSQRFGNVITYTAYVDATVAVEKTETKQRIFEKQLENEKGTHTISYSEAAREAYKNITPKIKTIIKEHISQ